MDVIALRVCWWWFVYDCCFVADCSTALGVCGLGGLVCVLSLVFV